MNKPNGKWQCLACGRRWDGKELYQNPRIIGGGWSCGDITCGGTAVRVKDEPETAKDDNNE